MVMKNLCVCDGCGEIEEIEKGGSPTKIIQDINVQIGPIDAPDIDLAFDLCLACQVRLIRAANPKTWRRFEPPKSRGHDGSQITLGQLITALNQISDKTLPLYIFARGITIGNPMSYRGYNEQLALDYTTTKERTVGDLAATLLATVGAALEAYKGGSYQMKNSTPVWVSQYGNVEGFQVLGVDYDQYGAWLIVRKENE